MLAGAFLVPDFPLSFFVPDCPWRCKSCTLCLESWVAPPSVVWQFNQLNSNLILCDFYFQVKIVFGDAKVFPVVVQTGFQKFLDFRVPSTEISLQKSFDRDPLTENLLQKSFYQKNQPPNILQQKLSPELTHLKERSLNNHVPNAKDADKISSKDAMKINL